MDEKRTLGAIVDEFIIESDYPTRHNWDRLYNIAIRVLKELSYDVSGITSYERLTLDDMNRACIPKGVVKVIGIDIMTNQGLIPVYEVNNKNPFLIEDGKDVAPTPTALGSFPEIYTGPSADIMAARFKNGETTGHQFRGGYGNPYTYLKNEETNKFEFSSQVSGTVVLTYLKNPAMVDGKFLVEPLIEDALIKGIHHRDIHLKKGISALDKREARDNYVAAKSWARMRLYSQRIKEISGAARNHYGQNPT